MHLPNSNKSFLDGMVFFGWYGATFQVDMHMAMPVHRHIAMSIDTHNTMPIASKIQEKLDLTSVQLLISGHVARAHAVIWHSYRISRHVHQNVAEVQVDRHGYIRIMVSCHGLMISSVSSSCFMFSWHRL